MNNIQSVADDAAFRDAHRLDAASGTAVPVRFTFRSWLWDDSPYIVMLLLALLGVIVRASVGYWLILTPVFGIVCIFAGWRQVETSGSRVQLVVAQALIWLALIAAIFILYNNGSQGVLTFSATTVQMMTLLALGTFVAGVQARVWRICAVGVVLFLPAPGIGLFEQSLLLLVAATVVIIGMGGVSWWVGQRRRSS